MIVRFSRWHVRPEYAEAATSRWQERLLPIVYAQCPGLIAAQFLGDPEGTERVAMTTWQSKHDYDNAVASGVLEDITKEFSQWYTNDGEPIPQTYIVLAGQRYREDKVI